MTLKRIEAKLDASGARYTPEGFFEADAVITRSGVFDYPEYQRKELRPDDEVFKEDSMQSLIGKSITFLHPSEMVDIKNVKKYEVGIVIPPVSRVDNFVRARMLFKDPETIAFIERARTMKHDVKLSAGYYNEDDKTPGEYEGQRYDVVQRNIRYNHVALVAEGRAGKEARIVLDHKVNGNNGGTMKKFFKAFKLDAIGLNLTERTIETDKAEEIATATSERLDAVSDALEKAAVTISEKQKTIDEQKAKLDSAADEKKAMQTKLDALSDLNGDYFKNGVKLRQTLDEAAEMLEVKFDGMDIKAQKVAIIEKAFPGAKMDGKSDEYINARFDSAVEVLNDRKNADNASALHGSKLDGKKPDDNEPSTQDRYNAIHAKANGNETK